MTFINIVDHLELPSQFLIFTPGFLTSFLTVLSFSLFLSVCMSYFLCSSFLFLSGVCKRQRTVGKVSSAIDAKAQKLAILYETDHRPNAPPVR